MKILIFLVIFGLSSAALITTGQCPSRPQLPAINVKKLSGRWYGIKVTSNYHERSLDCLHYTFDYLSQNKSEVINCEKIQGIHYCDQAMVFHDKHYGTYLASNSRYEATFHIFYIEYDKYAIVYECNNIPNGKFMESVWVTSREPTLSFELLNEAYQKMEGHFNLDGLRSVKQDAAFCGRN